MDAGAVQKISQNGYIFFCPGQCTQLWHGTFYKGAQVTGLYLGGWFIDRNDKIWTRWRGSGKRYDIQFVLLQTRRKIKIVLIEI